MTFAGHQATSGIPAHERCFRPHTMRGSATFFRRKKSTPAFHIQAISPADCRNPTRPGPQTRALASWKWNATVSFFFLARSTRTRLLTPSELPEIILPGPDRSTICGVAASPSSSRPRISSSPHSIYSRSSCAPSKLASIRFFSSRPASKYSSRVARSRTRFISSSRRPKVIRAITNSTPGHALDSTILLLCQTVLIGNPFEFPVVVYPNAMTISSPTVPCARVSSNFHFSRVSESSNSGTIGTTFGR